MDFRSVLECLLRLCIMPKLIGFVPGGTTLKGKMKIFPFLFFKRMFYSVYIIYSLSADRFYIGQTCNVTERVHQHNTSYYTDTSTTKITDWEIYWLLECQSRRQAIQIESHIKRMQDQLKLKKEIRDENLSFNMNLCNVLYSWV